MPVLNLACQEKSEISYKVIKFPDGQQTIEIDSFTKKYALDEVRIVSRLNNFMDLELILCATQCIKENYYKEVSLHIPYCIGARSDRKFSSTGINYIKNVIAPILNSQNYTSIDILDAHSDVLEGCINNFYKIEIVPNFVREVIMNYQNITNKSFNNILIVSPDAGSLKKIYNIAKELDYTGNIIIANKHREVSTGKITSTNVTIPVHEANKDIFIIDDICDGGRTFIELAKAIKFSRDLSSAVHPSNHGKLYLVVTHGIFSNGFDELKKYFDGIYTTNSIQDINDPFIHLTDVLF